MGLPPPLLWRAGRGLLSFPCLDRVRVVVAPRGRMFPLGVFGYLPFIYGLAAAGVAACGSGTRDPLVWGWCGFRAWWCWGGGDDGMPRDCACWVRLRGFLVFWWGVLLRASRCARSAVCLSAVSCPVACCLFVAVCFVCRILCGCAFRERACVWCDMVHAGWCGRAFDGDRACRWCRGSRCRSSPSLTLVVS